MPKNEDSHVQATLWEPPPRTAEVDDRPPARKTTVPVKLTEQRPTVPMEFSNLWRIDEVANYLGVPKQTIYCWRTSGYGPQGFRVGKHLRWRAATVIAWTVEMEGQR